MVYFILFIFDVLGLIILLWFFPRRNHPWFATSTGWCQLYNLKDMIALTHYTYSLMPKCCDVKNCFFGDGTLRFDILLGGLFALVCLF